MGLFSQPSAPSTPKPLSQEKLDAQDAAQRAAAARAIRDSLTERRSMLAERGTQSLVNPGLSIPE